MKPGPYTRAIVGARVDDPIVTLDEGRREGKIVSDKTCDGKSYQSGEGYKSS